MGNVGDNSVRHLKYNSWPAPSVVCMELLGQSRQPVTGRLATHPSNTTVKRLMIKAEIEVTSSRNSAAGAPYK